MAFYKQIDDYTDDYRLIGYKKGALEAALLLMPVFTDHSAIYKRETYVGHLQFYALTEGWEDFTETGYKSIFFNHSDKEIIDNDVLEYMDACLAKEGFEAAKELQTGFDF